MSRQIHLYKKIPFILEETCDAEDFMFVLSQALQNVEAWENSVEFADTDTLTCQIWIRKHIDRIGIQDDKVRAYLRVTFFLDSIYSYMLENKLDFIHIEIA